MQEKLLVAFLMQRCYYCKTMIAFTTAVKTLLMAWLPMLTIEGTATSARRIWTRTRFVYIRNSELICAVKDHPFLDTSFTLHLSEALDGAHIGAVQILSSFGICSFEVCFWEVCPWEIGSPEFCFWKISPSKFCSFEYWIPRNRFFAFPWSFSIRTLFILAYSWSHNRCHLSIHVVWFSGGHSIHTSAMLPIP